MIRATPPFGGTIFLDPDVITESDPTAYQKLTDAGRGQRSMYDRRADWVDLNAFLFNASFSDGPEIEIQVNPEFGDVDTARAEALKYAPVIGRLPKCLRKDVETVWNLAENHGSSWKSFDCFGYYYRTAGGWIYHADLVWLHKVSSKTDSIWLYFPNHGWMWTKHDVYPFLYDTDTSGWRYYKIIEDKAMLYDYATGSWMSLE